MFFSPWMVWPRVGSTPTTRTTTAPLSITTTSLPNGTVGSEYLHTLAVSGGSGNYKWSISAGSLPSGLSLDETSGTTAKDSSGNGYDGTLQGSFTFDTASAAGKFHKALDFNGVSDYVDTGKIVSDFGIGSNAARTVTAWVYTHSFNDGGIYEMGEHSDGQDFSLRLCRP
jgi:hypothetical protein